MIKYIATNHPIKHFLLHELFEKRVEKIYSGDVPKEISLLKTSTIEIQEFPIFLDI